MRSRSANLNPTSLRASDERAGARFPAARAPYFWRMCHERAELQRRRDAAEEEEEEEAGGGGRC